MNKIVVYITSCGIVHGVWERCKDTVELLKALRIKAEIRDLYIDPSFADELVDRMRLHPDDRELVYDSLPMVYVNGKYFGVSCSFVLLWPIFASWSTSFQEFVIRAVKTALRVMALATQSARSAVVEKSPVRHFEYDSDAPTVTVMV
ncbi:unnamed protein product [Strongylus vulgaris]|uniref:Uncharacterized protein n=1 Tax=Strongylus vulgaris TaxID=40348 RepID=A0A3P7J4D3_STRVU|nr:unnamed protein product [Strongylus vulgaris]